MTLPALEIWSGNAQDWDAYLNRVYGLFVSGFVRANHVFLGKPVKARWHPSHDDKHFSFWHVISESAPSGIEADRTPDLRRCERIAWLGYVLANAGDRTRVWCWCTETRTSRGKERRYLLYLHQERYLVILAEREDFFLLVTAFHVEHDHRHRRLESECNAAGDPRVPTP